MSKNGGWNDPGGLPAQPASNLYQQLREISPLEDCVNDPMTKAPLSAPRPQLLETMQQLNCGRIEALEILEGVLQ